MNIMLPVVLWIINFGSAAALQFEEKDYTIYLVRIEWHTGIVINRHDIDTTVWKEIADLEMTEWIDAGWGDRDFYMVPGFDAFLAAKALFYPTESTLRIEGFNIDVEKYIGYMDSAVRIDLSSEEFMRLCEFISGTYLKDANGEISVYQRRYSGRIVFYKALGEYHLFNTCNTWIAAGLDYAGIDMPRNIILAEQLFSEAGEIGKKIK